MQDAPPEPQREEILSLLAELRGDFASIRQQHPPIRIRLVHEAADARFDGVERFPYENGPRAAVYCNAGSRKFRRHFDAKGHPVFTDKPALDVGGVPITNSAGEAFAITTAAYRSIELFGDGEPVARLEALAKRGGQLVAAIRLPICEPLNGWEFSRDGDARWWALMFEVAWSRRHQLLRAERQLWRHTPEAVAYFPYDREQLRQLHDFPGGGKIGIPSAWLDELPDAYTSELDDAAAACADLAGLLVSELGRVELGTSEVRGDGAPKSVASEKTGSKESESREKANVIIVEDITIDVNRQTLTRERGSPMRWTGHETWRPFLELVKSRPSPIDLARWGESKDVARRVKEMLKRIGLAEWAERIHNQWNVGYYFADRN